MAETRPGRRTAARVAAVQALYEIEIAAADADAVIGDVLARPPEADLRQPHRLPPPDPDHLGRVVHGVVEHRARLDAAIAAVLAADLELARLEVLLAAILRAGSFELIAMPEIPFKVVISEYVDVAHAFYAGREPMLVNGVLDRLAGRVRPDATPPATPSAPAAAVVPS